MTPKKDYFEHKAQRYEEEVKRVDNVQNIADAILQNISYSKTMELMDFGSGTGLLTSKVAPFVKKITAVDMSKAMNEVLSAKLKSFPCELDIIELDLANNEINQKFHGIVSSMTIHHVEDILALFKKFYAMLVEGGTIALADLDKEDGSFHQEDTGVFHFGFDRDEFLQTAKEAGFKNLNIQLVSVVSKPYGDYPIFLLTGEK
ncbi:MAG: methyltransferase domain-containing protein [Sulfurospirillaceae bacterium]|nr:methyltransferase domain-containing protein [Sulfurospirillaceae bacterium]